MTTSLTLTAPELEILQIAVSIAKNDLKIQGIPTPVLDSIGEKAKAAYLDTLKERETSAETLLNIAGK